MKNKKLSFKNDVREKLLEGSRITSNAVGTTMGPGGRLAVYQVNDMLYPVATKDGVSVSRMLKHDDQEVNMGIELVRQAAERQVHETGDGTTLTSVLAHAIFTAGTEYGGTISNLKHQIDKEVSEICAAILAKKLPSYDLEDVATVAVNGDRKLGSFVAEASRLAGEHGMVYIQSSTTNETVLDHVKGYNWERGVDEHSFNSNGGLQLGNARIVVTDLPLRWGKQIAHVLKLLLDEVGGDKIQMPPVVFVCSELSDEAFATMIKARENGMAVYWMSPEGIGKAKETYMEDLATYTGAQVIMDSKGRQIEKATLEDIGKCKEVVATKTRALFINDAEVDDRVELLQNLITQEPFDGVKDIYRKSIARLLGGVVFLKIGGYSDTERKEIMDRAEDAVLAVESAKKGGVVVGGGVTLADIAFGKEGIVYEAIKVPKELIARNMGVNDLNGKSLLAAGIIDPVLVLQGAVRNSASVATIMLQCSLLITDKEEAKHGFNS